MFCSPTPFLISRHPTCHRLTQIFPNMTSSVRDAVVQMAEEVSPAQTSGRASTETPPPIETPPPHPLSVMVSDSGDSVLLYATTKTLLGHELPSEFELALADQNDRPLINKLRVEVRPRVRSIFNFVIPEAMFLKHSQAPLCLLTLRFVRFHLPSLPCTPKAGLPGLRATSALYVAVHHMYPAISGMVTCSEEGSIMAANATFTLLLAGHQLDSLKGQPITALLEDFFDVDQTDYGREASAPSSFPSSSTIGSPLLSASGSTAARQSSTMTDPPSPAGYGVRHSADMSPLVPRKSRSSKDSVFASQPATTVPEGTYQGTALHADGGHIPVAYTVKHVVLESGDRIYTIWVERRTIEALPTRDHLPSRSASVGRTRPQRRAGRHLPPPQAGPLSAMRGVSPLTDRQRKLPRFSLDSEELLDATRGQPKSMPNTPLAFRPDSFALLSPLDVEHGNASDAERGNASDAERSNVSDTARSNVSEMEGSSATATAGPTSPEPSVATLEVENADEIDFEETGASDEENGEDDDIEEDDASEGRPGTASGIPIDQASYGPFHDNYVVLGALGTGSFGCVRQAIRRRDQRLAVVKFLPKGGWRRKTRNW